MNYLNKATKFLDKVGHNMGHKEGMEGWDLICAVMLLTRIQYHVWAVPENYATACRIWTRPDRSATHHR